MKTALVFLLLLAVTNAFPLAFEKGKRYTFKYETEAVQSIPGGASKQIGLRLRSDCQVTMVKREEAQIKLENVKLSQLEVSTSERETPIEAVPQAIAQLEQHPMEVVFSQSGQAKTIRVSQNDPEWSRNIKRGVVNMMQIAPKVEGQDPKQILTSKTPVVISQKEPTIVGHCPVVYSVVPQQLNQTGSQDQACVVTKTIQYENCASRPSIKENIFLGHLCPSCQKSLGYVPYLRHAGQVEAVLQNRFLVKAVAEEQHVFTPMSELSGQVVAKVRQQLKYQASSSSHSAESLRSAIDTTLTFKLVHPEDEVKQNQAYKAQIKTKAQQLLQQLQHEAKKDISNHLIPQVVADLVAHLRLCDEPALEAVFQQISQTQDETVKNLCVDALSLAGTKEVMQLLKKKSSSLSLPSLRRIMTSLVFVPKVQAAHVDTLLDICENAPNVKVHLWLRRQCLLSYSALINRLSQSPEAEQSRHIKNSLQKAVQTLESKVKQATNEEEKQMYLKAIGNAGFPEHQATVVSLLMNAQQSTGLRVESIWSLRKMVHRNKEGLRRKLLQIFADATNDPELRMAVVALLLDKEPSFQNMQLLVSIVRRELQSQGPRSNQVASWVISKLWSLAYFDNNVVNYRARSARLALRFAPKVQFGLQYSKAMRIARFSEKLLSGFEMDINRMHVPQGYLPRNTNARLRLHFMGYRFDVLEAGARVEGLQNVIEDVLSTIRSRQKRSIWSSVMNFFSDDSTATPPPSDSQKPSEKVQTKSTPRQPSSRQPSSRQPSSRKPSSRQPSSRQPPSRQPSSRQPSSREPSSRQPSTKQPSTKKLSTQKPSTKKPSTKKLSTKKLSTKQPSTKRPTTKPAHFESDSVSKNTEVSIFMKMFNQEIMYTKITPQTIEDLVDQIKKLLFGQINEIQTALGAMKITKDSISIQQSITKAFLLAHARQMVPTLAGLPLHLHLMSSVVANGNSDINIKSKSSWLNLLGLSAKGLTASANANAKVSAFTKASIQVHTPYVRVGIKMQNTIQMKPQQGFGMKARYGHSYTFAIQNPTQANDVLVISPDPNKKQAVGTCGAVEIQQVQQFKITEQEVPLQISKQHVVQLQKRCYGEATTGVETCLTGRVPDLSSLRFKSIPYLTTLAQTRIRVQSTPKDQVKQAEIQIAINKNNKESMIGQITYKANGQTKREASVAFKYDYNKNQLVMSVTKKSPRTWGMNLQADFKRLTQVDAQLNYNGKNKYSMTLESLIDQQTGKQMTVKLKWNKLPGDLKDVLQKYEPQILYILQSFGSVSAQERSNNKIQVTLQLTSPLTAQVRASSPLGQIQSKQLSLPMRVSRLPLSLQEVLEKPFGQCRVQSSSSSRQHRISIFDQKSYSLSTRQGSTCQHILVQDKQGKLVKVAAQAEKQGQLRLIIRVLQPKQTTIVVKPDLSVQINNQPLKDKVWKEKGIGRVVRKQQRVKVNLNLKHFIQIKYQRKSIKILASPTLRDRVRGLCGDFNGEDYRELKSPQGKVLSSFDEFARSWRTEC